MGRYETDRRAKEATANAEDSAARAIQAIVRDRQTRARKEAKANAEDAAARTIQGHVRKRQANKEPTGSWVEEEKEDLFEAEGGDEIIQLFLQSVMEEGTENHEREEDEGVIQFFLDSRKEEERERLSLLSFARTCAIITENTTEDEGRI